MFKEVLAVNASVRHPITRISLFDQMTGFVYERHWAITE
jgi:hypothetical protein